MNVVQYILNKEVDLKKKIDLATHKGAIRITSIYKFHQLTLRIRTGTSDTYGYGYTLFANAESKK